MKTDQQTYKYFKRSKQLIRPQENKNPLWYPIMSDNFYANGDSMIKNLEKKFSDSIKNWRNGQIAIFEKVFNWC